MKRWAICKLGNYDGDGSITPALAKYPVSYRIWSHPTKAWCLAHFSAADITAISADTDIKLLPDATLDASWGSIPTNVRNVVKNTVEALGFTFSVQTTWTVRQVLNYVVNQINPGVDVSMGDVQE